MSYELYIDRIQEKTDHVITSSVVTVIVSLLLLYDGSLPF